MTLQSIMQPEKSNSRPLSDELTAPPAEVGHEIDSPGATAETVPSSHSNQSVDENPGHSSPCSEFYDTETCPVLSPETTSRPSAPLSDDGFAEHNNSSDSSDLEKDKPTSSPLKRQREDDFEGEDECLEIYKEHRYGKLAETTPEALHERRKAEKAERQCRHKEKRDADSSAGSSADVEDQTGRDRGQGTTTAPGGQSTAALEESAGTTNDGAIRTRRDQFFRKGCGHYSTPCPHRGRNATEWVCRKCWTGVCERCRESSPESGALDSRTAWNRQEKDYS